MKTTRTGKQWLADIGAIFVLAGLLALVGMVVQTCRIMANPATATGVVESKRMIEGKGESSDEYHLRYSFSVISGGTYHGAAGVNGRPSAMRSRCSTPRTIRATTELSAIRGTR